MARIKGGFMALSRWLTSNVLVRVTIGIGDVIDLRHWKELRFSIIGSQVDRKCKNYNLTLFVLLIESFTKTLIV